MTAAALLVCPDCCEPMDPVAAPRHPIHDLTAEQIASIERGEQARAAAREQERVRQLRADLKRVARARRRTTTTRRSR